MTDSGMIPNVCLICREQAVDITFEEHSKLVQCLDCGSYEILKLAARHIQEYALDDRRGFLEKAKRVAELQGGLPLIREPFLRSRFDPVSE